MYFFFLLTIPFNIFFTEISASSSVSTSTESKFGIDFSSLHDQKGIFNQVIRKQIYISDFSILMFAFKNDMLPFLAQHLFDIAITGKKVEVRDEAVYENLMKAVEFFYSWRIFSNTSPKSVAAITNVNENEIKKSNSWFYKFKSSKNIITLDDQIDTKDTNTDKVVLMLKYFEDYCLNGDQKCYEIFNIE